MEKDLGNNKSTCKNENNKVKDRTLYGNVFHRNICWQRSYQRPEGKEIIMALYGSLRDGLYNSRRFDLQNRSEFLGITTVRGYALYSLGPYPGIYPSEGFSVVAEVRRFSGKQQLEVAKSIDYMELFGGYHREYVDLEIDEQKIRGFIYVYDEKPETERIEHGDWTRYLKEKDSQHSVSY
ncbi:MAG: gamma-glutamylcyclotransferase [Methanosarcina barkeri]|nr:gamma-glutamylcyclotransferase [Methanosarcina sp. ERenArc_MAG2]